VPAHRIEQLQRIGEVVAVIPAGLLDRFGNLDQRCEVNHPVEAV
jgi:hypothetical protein